MKIVKAGLWQWVQRTGLERFELIEDASGWILRGTVLGAGEHGATEVSYKISCDAAWMTRSATIALGDDSGRRAMDIAVSSGRWRVNGAEAPHLDGCLDIDLGWSPSTNTIAIRRLNLPIGAKSGVLTMAWVRFPELTIEPLRQEYERLAERQYRYRSRDGSFQALLDVDEHSLVIDYEGIWRRVVG
jgi:hypothetical protein